MSLAAGIRTVDAATVSTPAGDLSVRLDETSGDYEVASRDPVWTFGGSFKSVPGNTGVSCGSDAVGSFQQISFEWSTEQTAMTGQIRLYDKNGVVLFSQTAAKAAILPPEPFPCFTRLPSDLHIFSHGLREFAPPQFKANEISTPWLLFDDKANAVVISPASHFMVASMYGDGKQRVASGFNAQLRDLPAGFTQQTFLVFGKGINRTWDAWGQAHLKAQGARRPPNDADATLRYLGYWTDNGAAYYYNYDVEKGYAGTLRSLVERYREEQIPIRYLQLDSWWYSKSATGADGVPGKSKKVEKLPEGEWNRYGGTLEYKAHKDLFPEGLDAFQRSVGLPLVTHGRWIDPASPYHAKYRISGVAAVDPKWWDDIATYLKTSGVVTYEQDWCDRIFTYSPEFSGKLATGVEFLDSMAQACKEQGLTMQYCMPYACFFLQGSRYDNLTTIRTCTDRFSPRRWNDFLYTSRLAASMGIWPWSDVYNSTEIDNVLLSTLSAGPVGIGDFIGRETRTNLVRAVRSDGVIVKPDAPIVPMDQSYLADARRTAAPLTSSTFTDHNGVKTFYVFAYNRAKTPACELRLTLAELGISGSAYVFDGFNGKGRRLDAATAFSSALGQEATAFYAIAPVGSSGIAFLGDRDKFVSTGKQRIASLQHEVDKLTAKVVFAESEEFVRLHGYAPAAPRVTVRSGQAGAVVYDAATRHFTVEVSPDTTAPAVRSSADPVREISVTLDMRSKEQAKDGMSTAPRSPEL
jgi:hypothetical protein